ncbi:MAG TPA: GNAT family N-acetyltransferase [Geodermatophilus sp.]|nr:GNAT family N-acetyltransferase [Geodermatophilus sp.]
MSSPDPVHRPGADGADRPGSASPSEGLTLRVPSAGDAVEWDRLFHDPAVMRHVGTGQLRDLAWYEAFAARQRELAERTGLCIFTVVVGGVVAGFTGIQPWPQDWGPVGTPEIGWRLGRAFWGRGHATTAARGVVRLAREHGVERVVALVHAENTRSVAVARRLGMTRERVHVPPGLGRVHEFGLTLGSRAPAVRGRCR